MIDAGTWADPSASSPGVSVNPNSDWIDTTTPMVIRGGGAPAPQQPVRGVSCPDPAGRPTGCASGGVSFSSSAGSPFGSGRKAPAGRSQSSASQARSAWFCSSVDAIADAPDEVSIDAGQVGFVVAGPVCSPTRSIPVAPSDTAAPPTTASTPSAASVAASAAPATPQPFAPLPAAAP